MTWTGAVGPFVSGSTESGGSRPYHPYEGASTVTGTAISSGSADTTGGNVLTDTSTFVFPTG